MSDYICPQCGQTYDMPGVCDICGVDLQPNDTKSDDEEEGFDNLNDEGFDDTEEVGDDILGEDEEGEEGGDDDEEGFDDE